MKIARLLVGLLGLVMLGVLIYVLVSCGNGFLEAIDRPNGFRGASSGLIESLMGLKSIVLDAFGLN